MERVFRELDALQIRPEGQNPEQKPDSDLLARVKAYAQTMLAPEPEEPREQTIRAALRAD